MELPKAIQAVQGHTNLRIYELLPAYPGEFGPFTLPLPRFYMRMLAEKWGLK